MAVLNFNLGCVRVYVVETAFTCLSLCCHVIAKHQSSRKKAKCKHVENDAEGASAGARRLSQVIVVPLQLAVKQAKQQVQEVVRALCV